MGEDMTDYVKTSNGVGILRFMVVRAHEKYMGSFYETREEAENAALDESNGDPGGEFHVMELISSASRPKHPSAILTKLDEPAPKLVEPKNFFLNEAHELPPIKKSELRKQNRMLRDAKKEGKKWCKICLSGPCGLWEHAANGSDFCRKHK